MDDSIFDKVEKKTNVKKEDILKLAKSISGKDLNDERVLLSLIKYVSKIENKTVSKEKEEKIINAVKKDKIPKNLNKII